MSNLMAVGGGGNEKEKDKRGKLEKRGGKAAKEGMSFSRWFVSHRKINKTFFFKI